MAQSEKFVKGVPITKELAVELRQLCFGNAVAPPRGEWTRTGIVFETVGQELSYGLRCQRNGTRGLHSALQGFILKYFLFDSKARMGAQPIEKLLAPTEHQQKQALVAALTETLMLAAGKNKIYVTVPGENSFIPHSTSYFQDTVTEKLYIFEMKNSNEVQLFIKQHLRHFTEDPGPGSLLILYSAVLTRTMPKIRMDMDCLKGSYLVGPLEEGSLNVVTLFLTGRATPHLHNGVTYVGDEKHYALPQYGALSRTMIGLLLYESDSNPIPSRQPGSRLKTPVLPIWVTNCMGHYGVIFSTNNELLRNYHAESRFDLRYYSCSGSQVLMSIDNRHNNERATHMLQKQSSVVNAPPVSERETEPCSTPIERLIQTKWEDARVVFCSQPSTLSYLFNTGN